MKIKDVLLQFEEFSPLYLQDNWDNSGLQFGNIDNDLESILISLDFGLELVKHSIEIGANLIITHHPVFFNEIKSIEFVSDFGKAVELAIKNDIVVYSSHTCLDYVSGGVNDKLAEIIGLYNTNPIIEHEFDQKIGLGRYAKIDKICVKDYIEFIKKRIFEDNIIVYGDLDVYIESVGVVGGSGSSAIQKAIDLNIDLLITGDIKYHNAEFAVENNLILVDLGHYITEKYIIEGLLNYFKDKGLKVSSFYKDKSLRKIL